MLEIKNFSKKYGDKEAVSHLSFVVNDGDIMGFVRKNGAGKTTTLKACMGIITITEGDILLDGISVVKEPIVCKRKMAYVPDTQPTIKSNLATSIIPALILGVFWTIRSMVILDKPISESSVQIVILVLSAYVVCFLMLEILRRVYKHQREKLDDVEEEGKG